MSVVHSSCQSYHGNVCQLASVAPSWAAHPSRSISAEARNKSAGAHCQSTIHVSKVKVEEVEEVEEVQVEGFVRQISMTSMTSIHLFHRVHKLDTLFVFCLFYGLKVFLFGDSVR